MKKYRFIIPALIIFFLNLPCYGATVTEKTISAASEYTSIVNSVNGDLILKGTSASVTLTLPSTVNLKGNLKLSNLTLTGASTIYANGYTLEIESNVTSTDRLNVYGGKNGASCENTNLKLYGGQYNYIYGGGNGAKGLRLGLPKGGKYRKDGVRAFGRIRDSHRQ